MALHQPAHNGIVAMTADAPHRRPGYIKTYARKACDPSVQKQIVPMLLDGARVRDTARVLGINRNTVSATVKKKSASTQRSPRIQP